MKKINKQLVDTNSAKIYYTDVFVPGGYPTYTYNPRDNLKLRESLIAAKHGLAKLVVVTGQTKSGKTVLVNKVYPRSSNVWIDGGAIQTEEIFWETIVEQLDGYTEKNLGYNAGEQMSMVYRKSGSVGLPALNGSLIKEDGNINTYENTDIRTRRISNKVKAIEILLSEKKALVIDDFHYIDRDIQKNIIRALKAPIMNGVPVICIAIPSRKHAVVAVEREMTGRIEQIEMPNWTCAELMSIGHKGFMTLNVIVDSNIIKRFAQEAFGSPFLMQEFCKAYCQFNQITQNFLEQMKIISKVPLENIFAQIAENSGRLMFRRLEMGPRARMDRKERKLKNGRSTDIYGLVMAALKHLKATGTVKYDNLRTAIKDISEGEPPQRAEITRILDKIAEISYNETSSTPVIDWQKDEDLLTITDPFFAFFLSWAE